MDLSNQITSIKRNFDNETDQMEYITRKKTCHNAKFERWTITKKNDLFFGYEKKQKN